MIKIYKSLSHDIRVNLAIEACLIDAGEPALFLWQNDRCVVIGAHQDPMAECNLDLMQRENVKLARRKSGGGAVYQDMGNACFTYIDEPSKTFKAHSFACLLEALGSLGFQASLSGRNDVLVDGFKVSGSAFELRRDISSHHATMLIASDLTMVKGCLTPSSLKLQSHGVRSWESRVACLRDLNPSLSIEDFFLSLEKAYKTQGPIIQVDEASHLDGLRENLERFSSLAWLYGMTPKGELSVELKTDEGLFTFVLEVKNSIVQSCRVYSDCLDTTMPLLLEKRLEGTSLSPNWFSFKGEKGDKQLQELALKLGY